MRRWFCIIALLAGFAGEGYAWTIRSRPPVPVVRLLDPRRDQRGLQPTGDWWQHP